VFEAKFDVLLQLYPEIHYMYVYRLNIYETYFWNRINVNKQIKKMR